MFAMKSAHVKIMWSGHLFRNDFMQTTPHKLVDMRMMIMMILMMRRVRMKLRMRMSMRRSSLFSPCEKFELVIPWWLEKLDMGYDGFSGVYIGRIRFQSPSNRKRVSMCFLLEFHIWRWTPCILQASCSQIIATTSSSSSSSS